MAHCNTIFQQMLKLIPRHHFSRLEQEHGTSRQARSFSRWNQLVHLVFIQITARASLRGRGQSESQVQEPLPSGGATCGPLHLCRRQ
jgi:hypothetical protein